MVTVLMNAKIVIYGSGLFEDDQMQNGKCKMQNATEKLIHSKGMIGDGIGELI
jgi:hypothetical protein